MELSILNLENECTGCGACVSICSHQCLSLRPNSEGFYYPEYDDEKCIECGLCEKVCKAIHPEDNRPVTRDYIYIYRSREESTLEKSSSGGAFTSFALDVLNNKGIVFATRYNADTRRVEVANTDNFPFDSFRKSKYVESYAGDSYKLIKEQLKKGRDVLFCGTPCQVAGLKKYLKTANVVDDNLITIDFVCHGVPSMLCLDKFLEFEESGKSKIIDVDFRYKDFSKKKVGWHNMVYCEYFDDGSKKLLKPWNLHYHYYYYLPFLENKNLRRSCYNCNQILESCADISIGDFWGIRKYKSIKDDNNGLSFVLFNNKKFEKTWLDRNSSDFIEKIPFYPNEKQYTARTHKTDFQERDSFYQSVNKHGYITTVRRLYLKRYIGDMVKKLLKKVVR
ncbi:MAG: Coenzyme F420 hydrogenase/dehydrogenase, beta subunit C-terminal domain [Butyrivibrio sp.]|nr:Coenzyme F420 hydrogenase/dehydrogenase, beta subunit C-terminal domain [Butyrivibrio sp.]